MSQRFTVVLGGLMSLGLAIAAPAGPAAGQTLEDALAAAYAANPTLLAKRAELRAADEGVPQALAGWRPSISASASTGQSSNYSSSATSNNHQEPSPHTASLTISQPLYSGGQTVAAISSAENSVLAARADLTRVEQSVLLDAVKAFVNVHREQAVLELRLNNEQVLKRQLEATADRFEVGEITRTDVHQAEARLAKATADRIQAEGDLTSSRATYLNVIGEEAGKLVLSPVKLNLPQSAEHTIQLAVAQNPSVLSAEFGERASRDDIEEIRGSLLPSLDLSGTASRTLNASIESTRSDSYTAKLTLTVPLYQTGAVYSQLRAARQTATKKRRDIDSARRSATETAARAWQTLATTRARIESFKAQIKASEIALEGVQREAVVGSRTVLDVLDAEQELLDAKVNIITAQRDETVAVFELKSAIGELTASHLTLPVATYDSKEHYNQVRDQLFGAGPESGQNN